MIFMTEALLRLASEYEEQTKPTQRPARVLSSKENQTANVKKASMKRNFILFLTPGIKLVGKWEIRVCIKKEL